MIAHLPGTSFFDVPGFVVSVFENHLSILVENGNGVYICRGTEVRWFSHGDIQIVPFKKIMEITDELSPFQQALLDCVQERYEEMDSDSNINTTVSTDGLEELNWN